MSKYLFISVIFILSGRALAAEGGIQADSAGPRPKSRLNMGLMIGYPWYNVESLKKAFVSMPSQMDLPVRVMDNHPVLPFYQLELEFINARGYGIGLKYGYISTGARLSYRDYSGEYSADEFVNCYQYGPLFNIRLSGKTSNINCDLIISAGIIQTLLKMKETTTIFGLDSQTREENITLDAFYFEPGVRFYYYWKPLFACLNVSLNIESDNESTISWTGLRAGVMAGVSF